MTKSYNLINATTLRTCVNVNGEQISIRFAGGMCSGDGRIIRTGSYITSDEKMQAAIESDSLYDKYFVLTVADDQTAQPSNGEDDADDTREKVAGVTNAQLAIEWLETNKEIKLDKRTNKAAVIEAATGAGVVFTDWK